MIKTDFFYNTLIDNGVDFFSGVPDSLLKDFCSYLTDHKKNIITSNEGNAIGLAAGYHLATGKIPLVYMQNSGIGNAANPLLSLADEKVYQIPMLLMIGWRGEPGVKDEPQHLKQGLVTLELMNVMDIPYIILDTNPIQAGLQIKQIIRDTQLSLKPHAIIIRKNTFDEYKGLTTTENDYKISREEALKTVLDCLMPNSIIVSTTGKLSRELFELRETRNESHKMDFLTVGSMGHSSSIALGIALQKTERNIVCFDGDGSLLMHTGALSSIGSLQPSNYLHILFNNGAHESVGGQPTTGFKTNFSLIAQAFGYKQCEFAENEDDIRKHIQKLQQVQGPSFLEIRINLISRKDLGRPTTTTVENKINFMEYVAE